MVTYNAAVGVDHDTVNNIISQLFNTLKPQGVLKISRDVGQLRIAKIDFSIEQAPNVDFKDAPVPAEVIQQFRNAIDTGPIFTGKPDTKKEAILNKIVDRFAEIWFIINLPSNTVTVEYDPLEGKAQSPTVFDCSFTAYGAVTVNAGDSPTLDLDAIAGRLHVMHPDDARIDEIANNAIVPWMIEYLNKEYLKPMALPVIQPIPGFVLSVPEPAVQNGELVVYSALGKVAPDIPPPFPKWPPGLFVAADAALITAAANAAISQMTMPHKGFNWDSPIPFVSVSGDVGVTLGPVTNVNILDDSSGNLTVACGAGAYAGLTIHIPIIPNVPIGAEFDGNIQATANAKVQGGEVYLNIIDIAHIELVPHIPGVPDFLSDLLKPLEDALFNTVRPLIDAILRQIKIPIYHIAPIPVPIGGGISFKIELDTVNTEEVNPAGDRLLVAYGSPKIVP